jgi:hypothetical protein
MPVFVITDTIRNERKNESVTGGEKKERMKGKRRGFMSPRVNRIQGCDQKTTLIKQIHIQFETTP